MDTKTRGLEIRRVALGELHQDPANARLHDERNLASIAASLQQFGQAEPLVVQKASGKVIGGNGRLEAMRALAWTECDVVELDLDEVQATALGIALNRTAELAAWDAETLGKILDSLRDEGALDGVGFEEGEIDEILSDLLTDCGSDVDDPGPGELPENPTTKRGDLWALGDHRLLCGDSRSAESLKQIMDGELAEIVWTDPPYGVSYVGKTSDALTIGNDDLQGDALHAFLFDVLSETMSVCKQGAAWYVAAPAGPNFLPFAQVLTDLNVWRQTLVWVKDAFVLGRSDFHYRHEAIFYGWAPGAAHHPPASRAGDTVWEVARPKASPDHPTTKPLELVTRALLTSSKPGALVLDPFAGSGTTLVAAESTNRRARVVELDPRYCDVVIRRWQQATGETAVHEETGEPFDQS